MRRSSELKSVRSVQLEVSSLLGAAPEGVVTEVQLKYGSLERRAQWGFFAAKCLLFLCRLHKDAQCLHLQQYEARLSLCLLNCRNNMRVKRDQLFPHSMLD